MTVYAQVRQIMRYIAFYCCTKHWHQLNMILTLESGQYEQYASNSTPGNARYLPDWT